MGGGSVPGVVLGPGHPFADMSDSDAEQFLEFVTLVFDERQPGLGFVNLFRGVGLPGGSTAVGWLARSACTLAAAPPTTACTICAQE